jgi:Lrp/AsnC family leucine-responsive transcriptional regulator
MRLDEIDRQLVDELRTDARASYAHLARIVGLSAPSVQERVRRLERRGVIESYRALLGAAACGLGVSALVSVYQTDSAERSDIAKRLARVLEIEDCWTVAGDAAFIVKVRVSDVAALETTIAAIQRTKGVARTSTIVVLSTRWEHRPVPLPSDDVPEPATEQPAVETS